MKLALIVPGGVDRSGTERVIPALLWLIERLAREHEVHVFALHQESSPGRWPLLGATVHNIGARPRRFRAVWAMWREHRRGRFDAVHAFWAGGPGVSMALFGWITGVRKVLTVPGGDLVAMPEIGYGARIGWRGRVATWVALMGADVVIGPSEWTVRQAGELGIRCIAVGYGVATDRWAPCPPRPRRVCLRLLHVASLNRVKDQPTLLRALARLAGEGREFTLDVVGEDVLGGEIQALAGLLGLEKHVRFHGFVPQAELYPLYLAADLLVMASRHEGVPIALLEAAVAGVPCVGTRVGQIADWEGIAALAVPVGDDVGLAREIARIDDDEGLRMALAREAQRLALGHDADAFAAQMVALYGRVN